MTSFMNAFARAREDRPVMLRLASLTVLLLATVPQGKGEKRNLSEIRFHFTPCGKTGRMGPSYQDCVDYYTSINSPIISENVLTDTYSSVFIGSQTFRAPRVTVYNVTIAGAAGGRGLCNSEYGRGLVQHGQYTALFATYSIVVGQRGLGPCDTSEPDPGHMLCQNPPQNLEESINCSQAYHQWLQTLNSTDAEKTLAFGGGAGGGGASLIVFREVSHFRAVSGGGGGSSSLLNYSVIKDLLPQLNSSTKNDSALYTEQLDANYSQTDISLPVSHPEGVRGYKVESNVTAGAGGGFYGPEDYLTSPEDGSAISGGGFYEPEDYLTSPEDGWAISSRFPYGGTHCPSSNFSGIPLQLRQGDGGFGGGGGGCGGGGGGGGYTGGSVIGDTNTTPGGGGYSRFSLEITGELGPYTYNSEGDGYVDIVAADCGCTYECKVYEEEDQFECFCPNKTQLAPDLSDCYYTEEIAMTMNKFWTIHRSEIAILYRGVSFGNSTFILSASVDLITTRFQESTSEGGRCVLMFLGSDKNIVLATNPVIGSGTATTLSEVSLNLNGGTLTMTDYTSFLNSSVLVTGAILASTGDCVIGDMAVFNVSVKEATAEAANNPSVASPLNISIISQLLQLPMEPDRDDPASPQDTFLPIIIPVCAVVISLAVVFVTLIAVIVKMRSNKRKKDVSLELNDMQQNSLYGSPEPNNACMRPNTAYGVAPYEGPYHLYESIPEVTREYEDAVACFKESTMIQHSTHDDESTEVDQDVKDSIK